MKLDNYRQIVKECFPEEITTYDELLAAIKSIKNYTDKYIQPEDISSIVISIYECYEMSGYSISDLPRAESALSTTLLLATADGDPQSVNVSYAQLSGAVFPAVKNQLEAEGSLCSMSYADKNDYALASHDHDKLYTSELYIDYPDWLREALMDPSSEVSVLGKVHVERETSEGSRDDQASTTYNIYCPVLKFPPAPLNEPAVGELKFLPVKNLQEQYGSKMCRYPGGKLNIDIFSEDFDGWVFPNGMTFTCKPGEFRNAVAAFGTSRTSFQVPKLDTFFQGITPGTQKEPLKRNDQKCVIGAHTHGLQIRNIRGDTRIADSKLAKLRVTSGENNPKMRVPTDRTGLAVAYFGSSSDIKFIDFPAQKDVVKFDVSGLNARVDMQTTPASRSGTYQPECQLMPVMMYIGPRVYTVTTDVA